MGLRAADATNAERIRFSRGELWFRFLREPASGLFFLVLDWVAADFFVALGL
jgi:hypothetical protein